MRNLYLVSYVFVQNNTVFTHVGVLIANSEDDARKKAYNFIHEKYEFTNSEYTENVAVKLLKDALPPEVTIHINFLEEEKQENTK